jgi:hypothetical protein
MAINFDYSTESITTAGGTLTLGDTGSALLPLGTTLQRPASPSNGMIRYNTNLNYLECYINGSWVPLLSSSMGSPVEHPGMANSQYYGPPILSSSSLGNLALTTNVMLAVPVHFSFAQTITRLGLNVNTAKNSSTCRIGIYSNASGVPGTLLVDSGDLSTGTTGIKEATVSFTFDFNVYWYAINNSGGPTIAGYNNPQTPDWLLGRTQFINNASNTCVQVTQTYGAMPSTFPTSGLTYSTGLSPIITARNI